MKRWRERVQEMNKGCDALAAHLERAKLLVAAAPESKLVKAGSLSSPTRVRTKSMSNLAMTAPPALEDTSDAAVDGAARSQTAALLAECEAKMAAEKEQLAAAIQNLSAAVNKARSANHLLSSKSNTL